MPPDKRDYHIAWILSSSDQQEIADGQFDQTFDFYSSTSHVTYRFGRVGQHNVVLASPASGDNQHSNDLIADDLLQNAPGLRAGFLISSDAFAPETEPARVGDVVVGVTLPDLEQSVTYFDAEETIRQRRLFLTGKLGRVPATVTEAVEKLRQTIVRHGMPEPPFEASPTTWESHDSRQKVPQEHQFRVLHGIIASSTRHIMDTDLIMRIMTQIKVLCFETAAATMKSRPLLVVAGIANHCGNAPGRSSREKADRAALSYLKSLVQRIDARELGLETPMKDYFGYESFDLEKPACRLLRLQGGTGELVCHLFQAYLPSDKTDIHDQSHDDTMLIPYEALSYCWGSNTLTDKVIVNGKVLFVTENLVQALGYLRLADTDRILWIDAICIDQTNVLERGHQVEMMDKLYSHADQVLIWLGNIDHGVDDLIHTLQRFEANVPREAWKQWLSEDFRFRDIWRMVHISSEDPKLLHARLRANLEHLMESEWFKRVWIIQEIARAKRALLGCPGGWINARAFAIAPHLLQVTPSTQCQAIIDVMPGPSRRFSWFSQKPNLATLFWRFRHSQSSDPRDRLYALLGLSSDVPITADYTKTEENLVKDVLDYWFQDMSYSSNLPVLNVATFQTETPHLLSKGLDQLIEHGASTSDVEVFTSRHARPIFLSEHIINYVWYTQSPLQAYFKQQAKRFQVIPDMFPYAGALETLQEFLQSNPKTKVTGRIIRASRERGLDFVSMMLDRERNDIEMSDDLLHEAERHRPEVLDLFLVRYGADFPETSMGTAFSED